MSKNTDRNLFMKSLLLLHMKVSCPALTSPTVCQAYQGQGSLLLLFSERDSGFQYAQQTMSRRSPAQAALSMRSTEMEQTATEQDRGESSSSTEAEARLSGHSQW